MTTTEPLRDALRAALDKCGAMPSTVDLVRLWRAVLTLADQPPVEPVRSGLTLTAEERAALEFARHAVSFRRSSSRHAQIRHECEAAFATIDRLLAGARTVTEPSALTVADALRDADVRKGAKWVEWVDASGAVVQFRMGETNPMLRAKGSDPWMACLSLLVGTLDRDATLIDAEVAP